MQRQHPLRAYRTRHGLSMAEMASALATTKQTVSRLEGGSRSASGAMLKRIAEATRGEVTPNDILMFEPAEAAAPAE